VTDLCNIKTIQFDEMIKQQNYKKIKAMPTFI